MIDVWGIDIKNTTLNAGDELSFTFVMDNRSEEDAEIDVRFEIHFLNADKKLTPESYPIEKRILKAGKKLKIEHSHTLSPKDSQTFHSGRHYVRILVNDEAFQPASFFLNA